MSLDWLADPNAWISLLTLSLLEIVLGIDNLIFISILSGKLPLEQQAKARKTGLALALITRILLLCSLAWVMKLTGELWSWKPLGLSIPNSGKDLILFFGGLFLVFKSVREIHEKLEGADGERSIKIAPKFSKIVFEIIIMDIIFSLDSVITAVGMAQELTVMIAAVIIAVLVMLVFVNQISGFVDRHPSVKMLALSFLILIGTMLVAESFHQHVNKGYIYFAMAFAVGVEMLNIKITRKPKKVELNQPYR
jgi:predicted tellurium resistance membrane protein TerC